MAEIAYVARGFENPLYAEEMNILEFLKQPDVTHRSGAAAEVQAGQHGRAAALHRADAAVPADRCGCCCATPTLALALSVLLYALTWEFGWNLPAYPSGHWFFNPFAWQLLFVFGAWCALGGAERLHGCCSRGSRWGSRSPIWCSRSSSR